MRGYKSAVLAVAILVGGATGASASLVDVSRVQIVAGPNNPGQVIKDLIKDLLGKVRGGRNGPNGGPHSVPGPAAAVGLPFLLAAGGYHLIRRRRRNRGKRE
jgi:hypothetical protein